MRCFQVFIYIDDIVAPDVLKMLNRHLVSLKIFYVGNISFQSNSFKGNFELVLFPYISFRE